MSPSDTLIRPAQPQDAARLHELHTASVRALCSGHYSADIIEAWLWNRTPSGYLGPIERGTLFVAEQDGRVVGFGEAAPGAVIAVYVDPANVRQGVGTATWHHAVVFAGEEHDGPIRLEATLNARDFYERAGFREIRRSTVKRNHVDIPVVLWNTMPANNAFERTAGSHSLAAAAQGGRSTALDTRPGPIPARLGWEAGLAGAPKLSRRSFDGSIVVDYALRDHVRPRHAMRSRTLFGLVLLLAILAARPSADAQQASRSPKIGFLATSTQALAPNIAAFRLGLRELGYIEGKTVLLEIRLPEGPVERLPQLARELVALKPDVIVATNDVAIASVRRETQTIPIVMVFSSDPAGAGFVASLARPGGNVTGLSTLSPETSGKRVELLREVIPGLSRVALLWNPDSRGNLLHYKETEAAARSLHVALQSIELFRVEDLDRAFSAVTKGRAQALIVSAGNPIILARQDEVASLAQRKRLPSIHGARQYVDAGGLMSYGPSNVDLFQRAATYVDKILKGAKPADLPVEQPTKFELVINLKTAKALGLTIPPSLLRRADHVIQ